MKFDKKPKKETFIGALRVVVNEETENFLRAQVPVHTVIKDSGVIFTKFPDGHMEIETIFERCSRMVKEMKAR